MWVRGTGGGGIVRVGGGGPLRSMVTMFGSETLGCRRGARSAPVVGEGFPPSVTGRRQKVGGTPMDEESEWWSVPGRDGFAGAG